MPASAGLDDARCSLQWAVQEVVSAIGQIEPRNLVETSPDPTMPTAVSEATPATDPNAHEPRWQARTAHALEGPGRGPPVALPDREPDEVRCRRVALSDARNGRDLFGFVAAVGEPRRAHQQVRTKAIGNQPADQTELAETGRDPRRG